MGHTIIIVNISEGDQEKNLSFCSVLKTLSSLCKKKGVKLCVSQGAYIVKKWGNQLGGNFLRCNDVLFLFFFFQHFPFLNRAKSYE